MPVQTDPQPQMDHSTHSIVEREAGHLANDLLRSKSCKRGQA